jgi:hypothetical protein
MRRRVFLVLVLIIFAFGFVVDFDTKIIKQPLNGHSQFNWLIYTMDKFHKSFDVYTDVGAAGNHFAARGKMTSVGNKSAVAMDECSTDRPFSGATCIKCTFKAQGNNWGGFYFMNGVLRGSDVEPCPNWGDEPDAGFNLTGATKVTFYAKGAHGGEKVEYYVGGIGWSVDPAGNSIAPEKPYPDSFPKVSTGYVTLTKKWKQYHIDLRGKNLSYVLSGFGWVTNAKRNNSRDITFYLDDVRWDKERLGDLRLLVSYETKRSKLEFDTVMRNVAFTYDNALVLIAFLARGSASDLDRARILANCLSYAVKHDRFYSDGRLRNAYMGADLILFPGWTPNNRVDTVRMPGFWDRNKNKWFEDKIQVSTYTGNVAWAIISLISAYQILGDPKYIAKAETLGRWVEEECKDIGSTGGYTGGFEGWEPKPTELKYKSTEHNLDLYVAFQRLYEVTGKEKWEKLALHAKKFVDSMWDENDGKFWTGTKKNGSGFNKDVIPLDVQAWAILAFRDEAIRYLRALEYAERHHSVRGGFDFNTDKDGIWYEGTAQMAAAYQSCGQSAKATALLSLIESAQLQSGAIPAASRDGLTTGFTLPLPGNPPWLYYHRGHIGATAWYLFAKLRINPYWL